MRVPEPIKWVGALLGLGIVVAVAVPAAYDRLTGAVEFENENGGGLFSDPMDDELEADAEEDLPEVEGAEEAEDEDPEVGELDDTYVVQPGDSGRQIAEEVYGDQDRWSDIAEANDLDPDEALQAGQELELP